MSTLICKHDFRTDINDLEDKIITCCLVAILYPNCTKYVAVSVRYATRICLLSPYHTMINSQKKCRILKIVLDHVTVAQSQWSKAVNNTLTGWAIAHLVNYYAHLVNYYAHPVNYCPKLPTQYIIVPHKLWARFKKNVM